MIVKQFQHFNSKLFLLPVQEPKSDFFAFFKNKTKQNKKNKTKTNKQTKTKNISSEILYRYQKWFSDSFPFKKFIFFYAGPTF